jgi:glycosyltransferase involved in cell wall biosynthesis
VPVLGQASETFLRRHVEALLPGGTVVVARGEARAEARTWRADVPTLLLDPLEDEWGGEIERATVDEFLRVHGVRSVLTEYLDVWLPFLDVFAGRGLTRVAHAHGYDVSMRLRDDYWRTAYRDYAGFDAVVAMSQCTRDRLIGIGLPADRLAVVPCGVDLPELPPRRPAGSPVNVLLAGRLVAKKNPLATLQACARAATAGASLRVTVIGDGPLMPQIRAAAASMPSVDVRGAQPHDAVLEAMRRADLFCQHSIVDPQTGDEEGMPVAILEAMAHGVPVVSTRHAGIPEAVADGVTGLLVDEGDVAGMAECIRSLAADSARRHEFGRAGHERVASRFTWTRERDALLGLLRPCE